MLRVDTLSVRLGRQKVLNDVCLTVDRGRVVALVGANGAGKSTLLATVCGLIEQASGTVTVRGLSVGPGSTALAFVGASLTGDGYLPHRTVRQNVDDLWDVLGPRRRSSCRDELLEALDLTHLKDVPAGHLSVGNARRLSIAMAMLGKPDLLVLDEPHAGLDPTGRARVATVLHRYAGEGRSVLYTAHELSEIDYDTVDVVALVDGRLVHFEDADSASATVEVRVEQCASRYAATLAAAGADVRVGPADTLTITAAGTVGDTLRLVAGVGLAATAVRSSSPLERWYAESVSRDR
ncbi:ABC transporter ATP-binding protein [Rhodococcoides kroppenstedtii]|uniref:ABC transporter ATP-binding protein n=1 Tax=Rhodococcoides kroppenstedtii TaxID=293050 RepID=UPI003630BD7E